ncbi:MAG: branched-chain amino acid ABC transporter permease [Candidatus Rokubacteria bacterium]|nr:branched-chain amino acid ABC transporter permease [Candidatus Rokubacteria bacterium]
MIYRECGIYRTSYAKDMALFPIPLDRWATYAIAAAAFLAVPLLASDYWIGGLIVPFLCFALAALGLNFLTGYAGQLSLGHAAFMGVGAYAALILYARYSAPLLLSLLGAGLVAAGVGVLFGTPSLRIKGFYLAVSTLAAQFIIEWVITHVKWIGGGVYATIDTPPLRIMNWWLIDTPVEKYYLTLAVVVALTVFGRNLVRSRVGRAWMAIRDRDVAAEIMGISLFRYKLLAFAVSSFYAGVAGGLISFTYYAAANVEEFNLFLSFRLLGMIIIGGMGSILGSYLGAGFIVLLPIFISQFLGGVGKVVGRLVTTDLLANVELMVFGGLIIFFLIVEPLGLARLWRTLKDYLRLWPFPY